MNAPRFLRHWLGLDDDLPPLEEARERARTRHMAWLDDPTDDFARFPEVQGGFGDERAE